MSVSCAAKEEKEDDDDDDVDVAVLCCVVCPIGKQGANVRWEASEEVMQPNGRRAPV